MALEATDVYGQFLGISKRKMKVEGWRPNAIAFPSLEALSRNTRSSVAEGVRALGRIKWIGRRSMGRDFDFTARNLATFTHRKICTETRYIASVHQTSHFILCADVALPRLYRDTHASILPSFATFTELRDTLVSKTSRARSASPAGINQVKWFAELGF